MCMGQRDKKQFPFALRLVFPCAPSVYCKRRNSRWKIRNFLAFVKDGEGSPDHPEAFLLHPLKLNVTARLLDR